VNPIRRHLPAFARHEGFWEGTYRHLAADGSLLDRYAVRIWCELPEEDSVHFRLHMRYRWSDGRVQAGVHEARYDAATGRARWCSEGIEGEIWDVAPDTVFLSFSLDRRPGVRVYETIQMAADGNRRSRAWQWIREADGEVVQWTLVQERRVSEP
jgi:hypothetical protein